VDVAAGQVTAFGISRESSRIQASQVLPGLGLLIEEALKQSD